MSRTFKLAALIVFVAVLTIVLTPADDGPVMELRGNLSAAILFALLVLSARFAVRFLPPVRSCSMLVNPGVRIKPECSPSWCSPLLC